MKNRDMFYQNMQYAYQNPGIMMPPNMTNTAFYNQNTNNNEFEDRISTLERQVKNLDTRVQKLESTSLDKTNDNFYMI